MNVKINSIQFKASKNLEDFVSTKIDKLVKLNNFIIDAEVFLRLENTENDENKLSEIKLKVPKSELFAKKQAKTFEEATNLAIEALRNQLQKHKERFK